MDSELIPKGQHKTGLNFSNKVTFIINFGGKNYETFN